MGSLAFITAIKTNAKQLKSRSKFKGLDAETGIYKGNINKKDFSPEQIQAAKDAFQLQVKAEKKKTLIVLLLTIVLVPILIYGLIKLYLFTFV
ncbi:hypothetical protein LY01_02816 [Nonlabens xylanidelens]|uniref:Uncharacterized protein n=1 Tax=Nonlabens xylanidelens TaxID=191564 RepID=A0A2S6IEV2_9FLAO|nr:hypothetical protein [Nonlabens xylanidelens]PPK92731.1 hypothetical protein LY01_02816 [Nonlabens xylanidelens]PQJ19778.1 hypothetical protein BST94_05915 [Nonlabens xylanidelens]